MCGKMGQIGDGMRVSAIIVAAGRGTRAGGGTPKQFRTLRGETLIRHTLRLFAAHPALHSVQAVIDPDFVADFQAASSNLAKINSPVAGGATRQQSVRAGLEAVEPDKPDLVLIHDAARPLASQALVGRAIDAARSGGAAIPALPVSDTIKRVDPDGNVCETLDRSLLRTIQTPQAFTFAPILAAHRRAAEANRDDFTDDAALAEWAGMTVTTFPGEPANIKITTSDDFMHAHSLEALLLSDIRTGSGFDVHAFGPGDHVMLGGVRVAHRQALTGHSDADVLLHAITDALLGAIAEGDIGRHFPPSDPQWRDASSTRFLKHAIALVAERGGRVAHLDATILCEAPKIGPHVDAIRSSIAAFCGVEISRISVKATTTEQLGFLGRGEGIAAMATATVRLPWSDI
jgi:2-C-methyl-D-erythritol 4-phosphate cytidylyltransferase / 2-C-methyl-D-erythritol 2,4-cyclodiphosphate synthase